MPKEPIEKFSVPWLQILNEEGRPDPALYQPLEPKEIQFLYEAMTLSRVFDEKALILQREGRLGTYAPVRGQEATQIGSALAFGPTDWIFPAFREMGVAIVRGIPMRMLFQYWSGDERGSDVPIHQHYFPTSIPVATHLPHAVGAAWAARFRKDPVVVAAYFGDGATSKGDFHEAMNMAGVFRLPVVFICQNNQWAISTFQGFAGGEARSFAARGLGFGIPSIRVDGNDYLAVHAVTEWAAQRARQGAGATLIELVTYRGSAHSTSDDPSRYRPKEDWEQWPLGDPVERLKNHLIATGEWSDDRHRALHAELTEQVDAAWREAITYGTMTEPPMLDRELMFEDVFKEMPAHLKKQRDHMKRLLEER